MTETEVCGELMGFGKQGMSIGLPCEGNTNAAGLKRSDSWIVMFGVLGHVTYRAI